MAPKIFITGISGYIGGQVLHDITKKHPEYQIRGLVRNEEQQKTVAAKYPSVQTVIGDLDSGDILKAEAAKADVVLQLAEADHEPAILSLLTSLPKTSTYIQLSGGASVFESHNGLGQPTPKVWSDITDLQEITTFDTSHRHAVTDQLVLSEGKKQGVRTAVIIPPVVFGNGEGPLRNRSMVLPWLVDAVKKRGKVFTVEEGRHVISTIHVRDLAAAIIFFVEESLKGGSGKAEWGEKGFYYVESGEYVFADLARALAKEMKGKGLIESAEVDKLSGEQAKEWHPSAEVLWSMNMRMNGERIRALGWKAKDGDAYSTIPGLLA